MSPSLEPSREQLEALASRPADQPVVMVNLLKFADGGKDIIGDGEKPWWDVILIMEYPSPAAFLDMVTNEDYLKIHEYRASALDRGDLIATSTWTMVD
jgi:hypothetical protein